MERLVRAKAAVRTKKRVATWEGMMIKGVRQVARGKDGTGRKGRWWEAGVLWRRA
jgi:hypothetical protein